jgi:hypothetical protein
VRPGVTRQLWVTLAVPARAEPGTYSGAVVLEAGRGRLVRVPLEVEVLPFALPPSPVAQGVLGRADSDEASRSDMYLDMARHGIDVLELRAPPATADGTQLSLDLAALDRELGLARNAGLDPAIVVSTHAGPLATRHGDNAADRDRHLAQIVHEEAAHAEAQRWPRLIHVAEGPDELALCAAVGNALCAVAVGDRAAASLLDRAQVALVTPAAGLDPQRWPDLRKTARGKAERELWLTDVGGARFSRGLYAWALGAQAVVQSSYTALAFAGDPYDDWDSDRHAPHYVVPGPSGVRPLLRWERARLGANDARYLGLVTALADKTKGSKGELGQVGKAASEWLSQKRAEALVVASPVRDVTWDWRLAPPGAPHGAALDAVRSELIVWVRRFQGATR